MADINVEMLKAKLDPAAKALFIISEILVDVSKSHISEEVAIEKIRDCMHDTDVIGSRYRVDKLIESCTEPYASYPTNIEEYKSGYLNANSYMFFADKEQLEKYTDNIDRMTQALKNMKNYEKR